MTLLTRVYLVHQVQYITLYYINIISERYFTPSTGNSWNSLTVREPIYTVKFMEIVGSIKYSVVGSTTELISAAAASNYASRQQQHYRNFLP